MRSALLFALLLHSFCASLAEHADSRTILCLNGTYALYFDDKKADYELIEPVEQPTLCRIEDIVRLCRQAYDDVSYGIFANETVKIHSYKHFMYPPIPEYLEHAKFKCIGRGPAKEPEASEGTWSDKLVGVNGSCLNEKEWIERATVECGKAPINYTFGFDCFSPKFTREIVFTCDNPSTPLRISKSINIKLLKILKEYAHLIKKEKIERKKQLKEMALEATYSHFVAQDRENEYWTAKVNKHRTDYVSRRYSVSQFRSVVQQLEHARTKQIIDVVFGLVGPSEVGSNHIGDALKYFDVENIQNEEHIFKKTSLDVYFPELQKWMVDYYVDLLQNNTFAIHPSRLSFLAKPNGHKQLLSMYNEIFSYGHIDEKYFEELEIEEETIYVAICAAIVTLVVVIAVVAVVLLVLSRRVKNYRVADHRMIYKKVGFDETGKEVELLTPSLMRSLVWSSLLLIWAADVAYSERVVTVEISGESLTDECIMSGSSADIFLWLGTLDVSGFLTRLDGPVDANPKRSIDTGSLTAFQPLHIELEESEVEQCVEWGHDYCFPHADVLFIAYNGSMETHSMWTPAHFAVRIRYEYKGVQYDSTTDHPMTHECSAWMEEDTWYQVGPRYGQFLMIGEKPKVGQWIRDWI
ncbi:hypothetical protein QR680_003823 [Steinernema hermaphroditum]|uniref:Uncharacterized protein n=1 Tax=Steinernema hermaphroditum TaxID=289476 RepID=A0AA39HMQ9_9BILA|nr:hypothetical protein QR680_003823 [Steinernema hermaphroditum]